MADSVGEEDSTNQSVRRDPSDSTITNEARDLSLDDLQIQNDGLANIQPPPQSSIFSSTGNPLPLTSSGFPPPITPAPNTVCPLRHRVSLSSDHSGTPTPTRSTRRNPPESFGSLYRWDAKAISEERHQYLTLPETLTKDTAMSRQRGRGAQGRDPNQQPINPEDLQREIIAGLTEAAALQAAQKEVGQQIIDLEESIKKRAKRTTADVDALDKLYRTSLKAAEEEQQILNEPPHEIRNKMAILQLYQSDRESQVRNGPSASNKSRNLKRTTGGPAVIVEVEAPESPAPPPSDLVMPDKLKRVKGGASQRSTSVGSQVARSSGDGVSVKIEDGIEGGNRGTNAEKAGQLQVGAEVVFKHNKKQMGVEGEGIQCIIRSFQGDGVKKKISYDIQDPEPNENGIRVNYKTTAAYLIPIPPAGSTLPAFAVGRQVLARYPDTTTFYRAEVMSVKKDAYNLKFEGEEDDKEMEVDRRFVLDIGAISK